MVSAFSTSIIFTWEQPQGADAVDCYEIKYNFTINECYRTNHGYRSFTVEINNGSARSYNLLNSTATPVEEDSMYNITLTAGNSVARSEVKTIKTVTPQTGT